MKEKKRKEMKTVSRKESAGKPRDLSIPLLAAPTSRLGGEGNGKTLYLGMGRCFVLMGWLRSGKVKFLSVRQLVQKPVGGEV
jgi:hypothetical protein